MSRSPDNGRRDHGTGGFTLVEVIVALGILMLVTAAVVPQVIVGLRAAGTARDVTQAKGVAQARMEQIRNMPFYVGRSAGDYIDALDTYYRNTTVPTGAVSCGSTTLTALPPTNWSGYVGPSGTHCAWEPSGPLYRKVINPISAPGLGAFAMIVSTQFLTSATPPTPVAPTTGYDSQVAGKDSPPASQIGLTVAVFYRSHDGVRMVSTYSQVDRARPMNPLIESEAEATTVAVSSATDAGVNLASQVGVINLAGELFTGSRVVTTATAGSASTSMGEQINAAILNLVAPTDKPATSETKGQTLAGNGCVWLCFGGSTVDQATASASNGLPIAGSATAPVRAMIPGTTTLNGFQFSNGSQGNRLRLDPTQPMVSIDTTASGNMLGVTNCQVTNSGVPTNPAYLAATGFLDATPSPPMSVAACATAQANTIMVFPTDFAPRGIVRITLVRATASCKVTRPSAAAIPSAAADYLATVQYYNGSGYTTLGSLQQTNGSDPLAAVPLTASVGPGGLTLGDYVSSWRSLTSADAMTRTTATEAHVAMPGAFTMVTQPTREGVASGVGPNLADPVSAISVTVGAVSCKAGDAR